MKICIVSKGRWNNLRTLKILHGYEQNVVIFVDNDEVDKYLVSFSTLNGLRIVNTGLNGQGVIKARNYALEYLKDEIVLMVDDDLLDWLEKDTYGFKRIDFGEFIEKALAKMKKYGLAQLGFGQPRSAIHATRDLRFFQHCSDCYLLDNRMLQKYKINYDTNLTHFEDFDLTLQIIDKGLLTGKTFFLVVEKTPMGYGKGGCNSYDRQKQAKESVLYLLKKWGRDIIKINKNAKHGIIEPKCQFQKLAFLRR